MATHWREGAKTPRRRSLVEEEPTNQPPVRNIDAGLVPKRKKVFILGATRTSRCDRPQSRFRRYFWLIFVIFFCQ